VLKVRKEKSGPPRWEAARQVLRQERPRLNFVHLISHLAGFIEGFDTLDLNEPATSDHGTFRPSQWGKRGQLVNAQPTLCVNVAGPPPLQMKKREATRIA
jgi:hypothetical protein